MNRSYRGTMIASQKMTLSAPKYSIGMSRRNASKVSQRAFISGTRRHRTLYVHCSVEAGRLITQGKQKFQAGDRMGALKFWEDALKPEADADINQRKIALFNATCVHASFGDVELAQITLREAIHLGLDYIKAVQTPEEVDPSLVPLIASQQVLIRLRKFNESTLKAIGAASVPPPTFSSSKASSTTAKRGPSILQDDLSRVLETDMQGIDTSVFGIVRRVFVLLLVLAGLGVALYLIGLQYLFPDVSGM